MDEVIMEEEEPTWENKEEVEIQDQQE